MKTLITIVGRGGSKGLPMKNIRPFLGKPLVLWTLQQAWDFAETQDECWIVISSDSFELRSLCRRLTDLPTMFVLNRPEGLSHDDTPKLDVLRHCMSKTESKVGGIDLVIDLDITNPIRTEYDILCVRNMYAQFRPDSIISVTRARRNPYFNQVEGNDSFARISKAFSSQVITRRQDCPVIWDMNCCIYAYDPKWLRHAKNVHPVSDNSMIYKMSDFSFCETDTEMDFAIAEYLMDRYLKHEKKGG